MFGSSICFQTGISGLEPCAPEQSPLDWASLFEVRYFVAEPLPLCAYSYPDESPTEVELRFYEQLDARYRAAADSEIVELETIKPR